MQNQPISKTKGEPKKSTMLGKLNSKSFSFKQAIVAVLVVVAVGGFFIYRTFAAGAGSYTWDTTAQWKAASTSGGPLAPTFANTMVAPNVNNGAVTLAQLSSSNNNIAYNRRAVGSAYTQTTTNKVSNVIDGNSTNNWTSAASDPSWVYIDLGSTFTIGSVNVNWGANYATAYHIDFSRDASNWTTMWSGGVSGSVVKTSSFSSGSARYVRIYGTHRASQSTGYQIKEIAIFPGSTYQPTGGYSVIYNAGGIVKWSTFTPHTTLNGGSITYSFCTAATASVAATGPWTSCSYNPNNIGGLANSQYLKINTAFTRSSTLTSTPAINSMTLSWVAASTPPPADTTKPNVSLVSPANGATLSGTVALNASATDNVAVGKVEFYVGSTLVSSINAPGPYSFNWNSAGVANGSYVIKATAYDTSNNQASATATVTVNNSTGGGGGGGGGGGTGTWWKPTSSSSISWNWIIGGDPASVARPPYVYDIQGDSGTAAANVAKIHANGGKAICYIDVGTYEPDRSDLALIPTKDIGAAVQGWPGEKWLNIADIPGLTPMVTSRMQTCKSKGFDAIEPDNIDGYSNSSGFPLTAANQLAYNQFLAATAHGLNMSIGLKNDLDQSSALQPYFDWILNEECNSFSECSGLTPFVSANKAAFNAEYSSGTSFCAADVAAHINGANFDLNLDGKTYQPCGGWGPSPL